MDITKIEWGAIASIIAGAVWLGTLQGKVSGLDSDSIKKQTSTALAEIKEAKKQAINIVTSKVLPLGAIIDYVGPIESSTLDAEKMLNDGYFVWVKGNQNWAVANGATIPESNIDPSLIKFDKNKASGFQVPNLINKFTMGVSTVSLGTEGGVPTNEVDISHSHPISPCGDANGRNALRAQAWHDHVPSCNERSSSSTVGYTKKIKLNNLPPYFGVIKIIRIK